MKKKLLACVPKLYPSGRPIRQELRVGLDHEIRRLKKLRR
jgi:hypothetical protein